MYIKQRRLGLSEIKQSNDVQRLWISVPGELGSLTRVPLYIPCSFVHAWPPSLLFSLAKPLA